MTFLGYTDGTKGFKFMRKPNNVIFHAVTALFDEFMFPHCPDNKSPGHTRIGREYPTSEDNIPPEDGGWFDGGANPPNLPNNPVANVPPVVPQGPQVPPQPPVVPQAPQGAPQPPNQPPWHTQWPAWQRQVWADQWESLGYPHRPTDHNDPILHPQNRGPPVHRRVGRRSPSPTQPEETPPESPILGNRHFRGGNQQQPQALPPVLPETGPSQASQPRRSGRTRQPPAP